MIVFVSDNPIGPRQISVLAPALGGDPHQKSEFRWRDQHLDHHRRCRRWPSPAHPHRRHSLESKTLLLLLLATWRVDYNLTTGKEYAGKRVWNSQISNLSRDIIMWHALTKRRPGVDRGMNRTLSKTWPIWSVFPSKTAVLLSTPTPFNNPSQERFTWTCSRSSLHLGVF